MDGSVGGSSSSAGGSSASGAAGVGNACGFDRVVGTKPILGEHTVNGNLPGRKELYALVDDQEAEALRAGASLVPPAPPVADPQAEPDVVKVLDKVLPSSSASDRPLIQALLPRFASVRAVWANPWALRLVHHAGSQRVNAVRVVLRDEAWIARVAEGAITVYDIKNAVIDDARAAAEAERVAAIFFEVNPRNSLGGDACETGRRELALANEAMVEEWSLGTPEISERLNDDLDKLDQFFKVARGCASFNRGPSFRSHTVCTTWASYSVASEYAAYQWSLATPSELYRPSPQNLAALIEALQADRFEPEPHVVMPEPPARGAGGAAGAGGTGGESGGGAPAGGAGG